MVIAVEVAVVGDAQTSLEVKSQVIMSPEVSPLFEYEVLLVPTLFPFNFH